jgi:hypothetical protein
MPNGLTNNQTNKAMTDKQATDWINANAPADLKWWIHDRLRSLAPAAAGSRPVLMMRHHDTRNDKWSQWKEPSQTDLRSKYGTTPDEWKDTCKRWIEIGGTYEFKILRRTDAVEWSIHYANVSNQTPPPRA